MDASYIVVKDAESLATMHEAVTGGPVDDRFFSKSRKDAMDIHQGGRSFPRPLLVQITQSF